MGAAAVAPKGVSDLDLNDVGHSHEGIALNAIGGRVSKFDNKQHAKQMLARLTGLSAKQDDLHRQNFFIRRLDPDTHSLRSVSLSHKLNMSRDRQYKREKRLQAERYLGILKGWYDED